MIELKPCPFCGEKARLFVSNGVRVLCTKCGATTWTAADSERGGEVRMRTARAGLRHAGG